jgi:biofilm PGA synthesis N-glycosyltransferase PgaC
MNLTVLYIYVYGSYISMCTGAFVYFIAFKRNKKGIGVAANDITVIVPFRNEELNLRAFVAGINLLSRVPKKIIFINDHSTDKSCEVIHGLTAGNYCILENQLEGKKAAVNFGVNESDTLFCLTWDADIIMNNDFFAVLEQYQVCDMQILPVSMLSKRPMQHFAELDYTFSNMMNWIGAAKRPILASGANLLFCREDYLALSSLDKHRAIASGDDMFLLQDFLKANKSVKLTLDRALMIQTAAPDSLKQFYDQRLRWIGKSKYVKDAYANMFGIISLLLSYFFLVVMVYLIANGSYRDALLLFCGRTLLDLFITLPIIIFNKRTILLLALPLVEIFYPFYVFSLLLGTVFYQPKWKGRTIK